MPRNTKRIVTASELRANVYKLLDEVLETGSVLEVERKGRLLRIAADTPGSKLDRLQKRPDFVRGDAADLVHLDWSDARLPHRALNA
jgi:hypothetical protein